MMVFWPTVTAVWLREDCIAPARAGLEHESSQHTSVRMMEGKILMVNPSGAECPPDRTQSQ